jgi:hypothetical protein
LTFDAPRGRALVATSITDHGGGSTDNLFDVLRSSAIFAPQIQYDRFNRSIPDSRTAMGWSLRLAVCTLHSALFSLHFALCTSQFALCTLHFALCTFQFALCIYQSGLIASAEISGGSCTP